MTVAGSADPSQAHFREELRELFFQRTRVSLWMGVVFFLLFSLLDFIYCRPFFGLFFFYRLAYVVCLLFCLQLLTRPSMRPYTQALMFAAMLLGALTISLMTVKLGGFASGYYVGILLMIAGAFSVLPLTLAQALSLGGLMYLVYALVVYAGARPLDPAAMVHLVNNSVFFVAIVLATTTQSVDELRTLARSLRAKRSLSRMNTELRQYTGNLEAMVRQRLAEQEESDLRFKELYDNVLDILLLIDPAGVIRMVNRHGAALLDSTPEVLQGRRIDELLSGDCRDRIDAEVLTPLRREGTVRGVQMQLVVRRGRAIEVETSGNSVRMPDSGEQYQLILRDITATKAMERQVLESERQFADSRQVAILGLARLAESRDDATGAHLLRIRKYTRILATELARDPEFMDLLPDAFIEDLCLSSVLHDIGKVGIADAVLLKAGKLTEAEFAAMRNHCEYGGAALSSAEGDAATLSFLRTGQQITRYHHENWDGSGYPHGLAGLDIPLAARIVALADVYDALTSNRPYKPAFPHAQARETIAAESGRRFDPAMVRAFLRCEAQFETTRNALQPSPGSGRS